MSSAVERIAAFAASARPEHLKSDIRQLYKRNILDSLGCAIAGLQGRPFQALREQLEEYRAPGRCTLIGGAKTSADSACSCNHRVEQLSHPGKQLVNWIFTLVLIFLGSGIVMVLVQMYHDPLFSRIANKKPNELGWDFFVKVASLIGLPLLSWLAYNYPEIGDTLFKIFQRRTGVVK